MEGHQLIENGHANTASNGAAIRILQFNASKRHQKQPHSPPSKDPSVNRFKAERVTHHRPSHSTDCYPPNYSLRHQLLKTANINHHNNQPSLQVYNAREYSTGSTREVSGASSDNSGSPGIPDTCLRSVSPLLTLVPVANSASVINNKFHRALVLPNGKKMDLKLDLNQPTVFPLQHSASYNKMPRNYDASPSYSGSPVPFLTRPSSTSNVSRLCSDASTKSWTSVGMGSTDGRKMIVRRVPTSPNELFNIVNPVTPPDEYLFDDSCDGSVDGNAAYLKPRRQQWSNKFQFVLACIGYSVGLGSVWRFPYLCYKSGGGVFLVPYFILLIICGVPLLYMELSIGQYTGRGPIGALGQLSPLFKGTGVASVVISFLMSTYYSVIIAYAIYYFFTSLKPIQPWAECGNRWNTDKCWAPTGNASDLDSSTSLTFHTPAEEFYNHKVLQISDGLEYFGTLRWDLVACLLSAWAIIYFAIWKSIKSSGKVRYFTATIPFLIIVILMGKSLTLDGAQIGMQYFFRPNWKLLGDSKVWVNAATQTFNSMGIAFGSMISFASYSKYHNNILHDTVAVSCVNALTSLLVGIFAFATIGNIAYETQSTIDDVIADGPGLIFVVFPQAMTKMPVPQFWASIFFFMLLCLALNSQFAIVEVVVTSVQDGFPVWIKKNLMCHEVLVFVVCIISFSLGLPNVTNGGIYFFQLIDHYAASISIMFVAFVEIIAVAWFYGVWRLSKNIEHMTGRQPSLYFKFCWTIAAPLMIFAIWVFYMIDYESPTYNNGLYRYPDWAIAIGWIISSFSILCLPIFMVCSLIKAKGENFREKLVSSLKPNILVCETCGERNCQHLDKWQECQEADAASRPMLDIKNFDVNGKMETGSIAQTPPISLRNSNINSNDEQSNDSVPGSKKQ